MYAIFSTANPEREREVLVSALERHDAAAACELMELDRHWEDEGWRMSTRAGYQRRDTTLAREMLRDDAAGLAEFELCYAAVWLTDGHLVGKLQETGVWGEHPRLPQSSRLAAMAARALVSTKTATPKELLAAWGDPLTRRVVAQPADRVALDLLAWLVVDGGDQARLRAIDRQGWKTLHLSTYATSDIASRMLAGEPVEADLQAAFAEFPDDDLLAQFRLRLAKPGPERERARLDMVAAAFAHVFHPHPADASLGEYMADLARAESP